MRRRFAVPQRDISNPHGISETLCLIRHSALSQGANGSCGRAIPPRQAPNTGAVDTAKRCHRHPHRSRQTGPADRSEGAGVGMAQGRECGGEEGE